MKNLTNLREKMVQDQIISRGVQDEVVLNAMRKVPRHLFVPIEYQLHAYDDRPLPIGYDQTISQPYIVALMSEMLQLQPEDIVLEVGTGSGYQAAVLGCLVSKVYTIERHGPLAQKAAKILRSSGFTNVTVIEGDGSLGFPDKAPFDAVIITAAAPALPKPICSQLKRGGRIVLPVGNRWEQNLQLWRKMPDDQLEFEKHIPVSFVPLRGEHGWRESEW
ncbi:MAG: protein-L-isoaspartate O-methyltransferase [Chloroflexi bacterium HGW-Chloroflexi-10]|nr:MAG: protein-L-isoaspartate O-methyltransferase [Chloroflexi bacterium HGW-Chloroflexi-10]